ncbi:hypothetical protein [Paenibacillus sp. GYB003]|uniref:hypothetical protein n=1 Tax=Paenibacillus sp. GYB003 TaxID=2994392 RepID=UPI002F96AA66
MLERDALGRTTREHLSPQVQRQFEYDGRGLLIAQTVFADAAPLFEMRYDYDRTGNRYRLKETKNRNLFDTERSGASGSK